MTDSPATPQDVEMITARIRRNGDEVVAMERAAAMIVNKALDRGLIENAHPSSKPKDGIELVGLLVRRVRMEMGLSAPMSASARLQQ